MLFNHYKRLKEIKFENIKEGYEIHRKLQSFYLYQTHTCIIYKKTENENTTLVIEIDEKDNKIKLNTFKNFNIHNKFYIRNDYKHTDIKNKEEIINEILNWLNKIYDYHIVYNNCQYFTMKCILKNNELVDTKYPIAEFEKILYKIYKMSIVLFLFFNIYIMYKLFSYIKKWKMKRSITVI